MMTHNLTHVIVITSTAITAIMAYTAVTTVIAAAVVATTLAVVLVVVLVKDASAVRKIATVTVGIRWW